jgi:hypothetical protein
MSTDHEIPSERTATKRALTGSAVLSMLLLLVGGGFNNDLLVGAGLVLTLVASVWARPFQRTA